MADDVVRGSIVSHEVVLLLVDVVALWMPLQFCSYDYICYSTQNMHLSVVLSDFCWHFASSQSCLLYKEILFVVLFDILHICEA